MASSVKRTVVTFVLRRDPREDPFRFGQIRFGKDHLVKAAVKRAVLLDVAVIFVDGRGADARSIPRASSPFRSFAASEPPSPAPAPIIVCISSMKRITRPFDGDFFRIQSLGEFPRIEVPETRSAVVIEMMILSAMPGRPAACWRSSRQVLPPGRLANSRFANQQRLFDWHLERMSITC